MATPDQMGTGGRARRGSGAGRCGGAGGPGAGGGRYRRAVLETAILSSLAHSTSHGYDLVDQIDDLASGLVCVDAGSMYRMLRSMEEEGLVTSSWETPESGPSRRVYTINERGLEALEMMARSLTQQAAAMRQLADHARQAATRTRSNKETT